MSFARCILRGVDRKVGREIERKEPSCAGDT